MHKHFGASVVALALLMPLISIGQTAGGNQTAVSQLQAQIQSLLQQVQTLQQQISSSRQGIQDSRQELRATVKEIRSQLRLGVTNEEVKLLQELLATDPAVYPEQRVTGYFGPLTKKALIRFQQKHGIEGIGEAGPQTRRLLNAFLKKEMNVFGPVSPQALKKFTVLEDDDGNIISGNSSIIMGTASTGTAGGKGKGKGLGKEKVVVCHIPPGNPAAAHTLTVGTPALGAHIAHGDTLGSCANNGGGGGTGTTTPDSTAPVLSSITATSIATSTAHVTWTTNEPATSKVWYSISSPLNTVTAPSVSSSILVTGHDMAISGLTASTTYYYLVESKDANNNTATSSQYSFITQP